MAVHEAPPAPPPVGPPHPKHRRGKWVLALAAVAVLGLVAGLLVWAPWHQDPVPPAAVHAQSPTATSVLVSWSPSKGGATIDRYLVLRDGAQVGSVPVTQTSYNDHGLAPGTRHQYTIIAVSGTQRSGPSVKAAATTITPSPVALTAGRATWTTVAFHWSPSPKGPVPDKYLIYSDGTSIATLPGTTSSYAITGLDPDTAFEVQVAAMWGTRASGLSPVLPLATLAPPLQGDMPVQVNTVSTPGEGASLNPGQKWSDTWGFTPGCTANGCTLKTDAQWAPPDYKTVPFTVTLTRSGAWYTGTTKAPISMCRSVTVQDTVTLRIAADSGAVSNGAWNSWHGTWVVSTPYTTADGGYYCPAQSWHFSISGTTGTQA